VKTSRGTVLLRVPFGAGIAILLCVANGFLGPNVARAAESGVFTILDRGDVERLRASLQSGADPNERNAALETPLLYLTHKGSPIWAQLAAVLIDAGRT